MLRKFSCFGTAAVYQGASCPGTTSAPRRPRQQGDNFRITDAGASAALHGAASAAAPNTQVLTSIWLHPLDTVQRGSPELESAREAGGGRVAARGRQVQQKFASTSRGSISERQSSHSRSRGSTRPEDFSPQVTSARDIGGGRRRGSKSNTSASAGERRRQRLGERQVLVFSGRGQTPAGLTTKGIKAADALQQREGETISQGSGGSDTFTEDSEQNCGRAEGARNRGAVALDGGSSREPRQTARSGAQTALLPLARPHTEDTARGRRAFWGEFNFPDDVEYRGGNSYLAQDEGAGDSRTPSAAGDEEGTTFLASFHRRQRRRSTDMFSAVQEDMRPPLTVKPCIWLTPLFAVDGGGAAGPGAEAGLPGPEEPVEAAGGETAAVSLPTYADHASLVTSPKAIARELPSSESAGDGTLLGMEGNAANDAIWSGGTHNVRLLRKVSWRPHERRKRSSAVRFFAKRIFWVFWYFVVANLIMCSLSTVSDVIYQHKPQPKLHDRFHDWILGGSPVPGLVQTVTDVLTVSLLAITLLRHLLFVQLPLNLMIICRYFVLMGTTYWLRGIAIFLTTMPSSVPNCQVRPVHSARDFVENVILASLFQLRECTDMIISGHTLCTCLCVATWLFYNNCNKDEGEMQQAPFHIFLRWLLRHRNISATAQEEQGCYSPSAIAEPVGRRHQQQQRQQMPEQRSRNGNYGAVQVVSGSEKCAEGSCAAKRDSLSQEGNRRIHRASLCCAAPAVEQDTCGTHIRRASEISSSCRVNVRGGPRGRSTSSDTARAYGLRVADDVYRRVELRILSAADSSDERQYEGGGGTAGEGGNGHNMEAAKRRTPTAVGSVALLRNEAVSGAAVAVTETFVAAAAAASEVVVPAAASAGRSFSVDHVERCNVSVREVAAWLPGGTASAACAGCAVRLAACDGEDASSSAACAAQCAAVAAAAVVEEAEGNSRAHVQEVKNSLRTTLNCRAAGAAEQMEIYTDDKDHRVSKTPVKAGVQEQGAREIRGTTEDLLLLTDRRDGGTEASEGNRIDSEFPKACHVFSSPAALGEEWPLSRGHGTPVTTDEKSIFLGAHAAGEQGKEPACLVSASACDPCSVPSASTAVDNGERLPPDGRPTSQCTVAGSCFSAEEDDVMRALLAHQQSRLHQDEKENTRQVSRYSLPRGLSSFFGVAHTSCAPVSPTKEDASANIFVPVDEAAATGEDEGTEERGNSTKDRYYKVRAQGGELERMGQHDTGEGPAARSTGKGGRHGIAAGRKSRGGFQQCCSACLSRLGRRLAALLWWACKWNLLGTWCILQAAANIIIIDASFCHYTVDIFFGILLSFGCFTWYHMIVCLLWAAKTQNVAGAADVSEGYYAVVGLHTARVHRRRSSYGRNVDSSTDSVGTTCSRSRAAGVSRKLPSLYSRSRPCVAREGTESGLGMMHGAGRGAAARELGGAMLQTTAGIQKFYGERLGGRGRKDGEAERGGNQSDEDPGLQKLGCASRRVGESPADVLSIERNMESCVPHTGREGKVLRVGDDRGRTTLRRAADTPVQGVYHFATAETAVVAVSTPSVNGDAELALPEALMEDKEMEEGWCREVDGVQLPAHSEQRKSGAPSHVAAAQQQDVQELPAGHGRHMQTSAYHLRERPAETRVTNLEGARVPRLPQRDSGGGAPKGAKEQQSSASGSSVHASKSSDRSCARGAAPAGVGGRGAHAPAAAAQREALQELSEKVGSSRGIGAKGSRTRGRGVLQSMERIISRGPRGDVAADIAVSILRFPLIRCAAFFVARLEGLELP